LHRGEPLPALPSDQPSSRASSSSPIAPLQQLGPPLPLTRSPKQGQDRPPPPLTAAGHPRAISARESCAKAVADAVPAIAGEWRGGGTAGVAAGQL
ncbi:unnamed protein product, partial [Urochloa humidicola]